MTEWEMGAGKARETLAELALRRRVPHAQDQIVVSFLKARFAQADSVEPMAGEVRLRSVST